MLGYALYYICYYSPEDIPKDLLKKMDSRTIFFNYYRQNLCKYTYTYIYIYIYMLGYAVDYIL